MSRIKRGTTTRAISEVVGILSGSLFHYFKSKDQMLFEIMHDAADSMCARADAGGLLGVHLVGVGERDLRHGAFANGAAGVFGGGQGVADVGEQVGHLALDRVGQVAGARVERRDDPRHQQRADPAPQQRVVAERRVGEPTLLSERQGAFGERVKADVGDVAVGDPIPVLDYDTNVGEASGGTLVFKGVPLGYLPWADFPLSDQRRSGVLCTFTRPEISPSVRPRITGVKFQTPSCAVKPNPWSAPETASRTCG